MLAQAAISKMSIQQTDPVPTEYKLDDMHKTQEYFKSSTKLQLKLIFTRCKQKNPALNQSASFKS